MSEQTKLTARAHQVALTSVQAEASDKDPYRAEFLNFGEASEYAGTPASVAIFFRGYWTIVRGQSSAGGHGKQGADPAAVAFWRNEVRPVRFVFVDAGDNWQAVWLGINEPEVVNLDNDTTHRRQGWRVRDMERGSGLIDFPQEAPAAEPAAQERLVG